MMFCSVGRYLSSFRIPFPSHGGWRVGNDLMLKVCVYAGRNKNHKSVKYATFTLATLVSLHYKIYSKMVKLATFKNSYLNKQKWQKLVLMNTFCEQDILQ